MKYLGESEEFSRKKTKTGYKVFNFRMNEFELDTITFLIDMYKMPKQKVTSELGRELQIRLRSLRRGIMEAKESVENR